MKKTILALALASTLSMATETTITATMSLMSQGLNQVQTGLMYNNQEDIKAGISVLENANAIFKKVDVSTFIKNNHKIQVTKNINDNFDASLKKLKEDVNARRYGDATKSYANVMKNCLSCHTIIRGW